MCTYSPRSPDGESVQATRGCLRVLAIIPRNREKCSFIFARRQAASLQALGIEVRIFLLNSRTSPVVILKEHIALKRVISHFRPDVVHAHYGSVTSLVSALGARNTPLVITFRGNDLHDDPDVGYVRLKLSHLFSQIAALRATRIICVSRRLLERLWWRRDRASVIPSGVDLELFQPRPQREARAHLGWNLEARIVLLSAAGCHERMKGVEFIRAAIREAENAVGPIRLVIMDGMVAPELVPCHLNAADCVALASVNEGSPNIVKEALACNLPIISTDVGDVAERLRDVTPSRVVKREVPEFAAAMAALLRQRARSNGRDQVVGCSNVRVAEAIQAVYESSVTASAMGVSGQPVPVIEADR